MDRTARLRQVLEHARNHPVYAPKLEGIDLSTITPETIARLPLTTREEWIAYVQANPNPRRGRPWCT